MRMPAIFRKLSPAELLAKQLADAQISRITYAASAEEHTQYVKMLDARIARIRAELQAMTTPETKDSE